MLKNIDKTKGSGFVELIIGLSIIFVALTSVVSSYNFFFKVAKNNTKVIKAEFLLEEGVEVLKFVRDSDWTNISSLSSGSDYYLSFDGSLWSVSNTNVYIDDTYERKFVISDVYRDVDDNIAGMGALDIGTKDIEVFVSWLSSGATSTRSINIILTDLFSE
ncbi:hypothetical protein A2442_01940 [Candidatus Campbellbacteria bacterium RIFOXYC2_FULL_35_25]|uniref:Uncharacterized protein n=1 Tax=Candidatus Campbellbacteria bacterium RIFOXYC2_FULL_35_25 TaxID=1797582 RepID=A0A1F5EI88_9BACT|nr:MAG: hypothetical protein A2442_01940 [Candidatus Campbellbacteria bacterium RIFOXYC2_FULL_35_25]